MAISVGTVALLLAGVAAWQWLSHGPAPDAPSAATGPALEARLLAEAAREPKAPDPYLRLAEQYAASDRTASALWAYQEAATRDAGAADARLKSAAALRQMGFPASAEANLRSLLTSPGPAAGMARLELADILLATGRPAEALALLKRAGKDAGLPRGRAYEAMGDLKAAASSYRSAGDAGDADGFARLARLELAAGRVTAAREAVRSMGRLQTPRPDDLMLYADAYKAGGTSKDLDSALSTLLRCAQLQPNNAKPYYQAGLIFQRRGDRAAALAQFERAARLDPNDAAAHARLADLLAAGQQGRSHRERAIYYSLKDQPDRSLVELQRAAAAGFPDDLERTLAAARTASELQQQPVAVAETKAG